MKFLYMYSIYSLKSGHLTLNTFNHIGCESHEHSCEHSYERSNEWATAPHVTWVTWALVWALIRALKWAGCRATCYMSHMSTRVSTNMSTHMSVRPRHILGYAQETKQLPARQSTRPSLGAAECSEKWNVLTIFTQSCRRPPVRSSHMGWGGEGRRSLCILLVPFFQIQ